MLTLQFDNEILKGSYGRIYNENNKKILIVQWFNEKDGEYSWPIGIAWRQIYPKKTSLAITDSWYLMVT